MADEGPGLKNPEKISGPIYMKETEQEKAGNTARSA